jgi:hypothetical protein
MEIYKTINGYEKYSVSDKGNVYSHKSKRLLKPIIRKDGYFGVELSNKFFYIHRLVLITFKGYEERKEVNHIDGVKSNNTLENLEWLTHKENIIHSVKNNLVKRNYGSKHHMSKISESDVVFIRQNKRKYKYKEIMEMFNISKSTLKSIYTKKTWRHI